MLNFPPKCSFLNKNAQFLLKISKFFSSFSKILHFFLKWPIFSQISLFPPNFPKIFLKTSKTAIAPNFHPKLIIPTKSALNTNAKKTQNGDEQWRFVINKRGRHSKMEKSAQKIAIVTHPGPLHYCGKILRHNAEQ
jgi:hypothetical protein